MYVKNITRNAIGLLVFAVITVTIAAAVLTFVKTAEADKNFETEVSETDARLTEEDLSSKASMNASAIVEVVTEPNLCNGGRLRFTGVPSGEIILNNCGPNDPAPVRTLSVANLSQATNVSTLDYIDPSITDLGYRLIAVRCDDSQSNNPSTGDLENRQATFKNDPNETVTCKFILSTAPPCVCPLEGNWNVKNHAGTMACSGTFSMTHPLKPATTRGTIKAQNDCATLVAEGMTDDEATIIFRRTPQCTYKGSVGGSQSGIPMIINFTLDVTNEKRLTGELTSTVSEQGTTCNMNRTYELDYADTP